MQASPTTDREGVPPPLAADENLGRLARYLRLAGLDVAHRNPFPDGDLERLCLDQDRVILTMDSRLARRLPRDRCLPIESHDVEEQAVQVFQTFPVNPLEHAFTRCTVCNTPFRKATPEEVEEQVPEGARRSPGGHFTCTTCGKVFWKGSHTERMRLRLARIRARL